MTTKIQAKKLYLIVLTLFFIMPSFVLADEARFIYPINKTLISVPNIRLIGNIGNSKNINLTIKNKSGEKNVSIASTGKYFNSNVKLAKGINTVSITSGSVVKDSLEIIYTENLHTYPNTENYLPYYVHSDKELTDECKLCHADMQKNVSSDLEQKLSCITSKCHTGFDQGKFKHGPFEDGSCIECHNPHGSENKNFLKFPGGSLCFTCHSDAEEMIGEDYNVHYPVLKRDCTACHDPHKSNLEYHLKRNSISELCAGCHEASTKSNKVMHAPVESGDCIVCHKPHISKYKGLLEDEGTRLCLSCHTVRKEEFNRKHVHAPVAKDCTLCHDPHGSDTIYHLRIRQDEEGNDIIANQPFKELCLSCHRKLNPEIADRIDNAKIQHEPVLKGKCTVCHTPHSTDYAKQLKAPLSEICFSCHKKMAKLIKKSDHQHGPIHTNNCAQCHQPHGSDNRLLLRSKFSDKYADTFNMDNYALCFNCHNPNLVLDDRLENTEFRNGSTNLHYIHVNREKNGRSCKTCHEIHASDQEKHMRKNIPFKGSFTITLKYKKTTTGGGCIVGCHKPRKYDRFDPVGN